MTFLSSEDILNYGRLGGYVCKGRTRGLVKVSRCWVDDIKTEMLKENVDGNGVGGEFRFAST